MNAHFFLDPGSDIKAVAKDTMLRTLQAPSLCPFAAHTLFPYVLSFQKGSWFRWRKDKNSVVAQCPNPDCAVIFRVQRQENGSVTATVESVTGVCQAGHKAGDIFGLDLGEETACAAACAANNIPETAVEILRHSPQCRYYQKPGPVKWQQLVPPGFCLSAYAQGYPYALSLLYDGKNFAELGKEQGTTLLCPNAAAPISFQVRTRHHLLSWPLNILEKLLRRMGWPRDVIDKLVVFAIVPPPKPCPMNLRAGQKFFFNIYNRCEVCPAVFYTVFPFMLMLKQGAMPYWTKDRKSLDLHCPDAGADIVYRVSRKG